MASNSESRSVSIFINGVQADNTLKELTAASTKLRNEIARLDPTSQEFVEKSERFREVQARLAEVREDVAGVNGAFEQLQERALKVGEVMGVAFGIEMLVDFAKELTAVELQAEGVHNAFSKIGNTTGYIEKLRESSRGLIGDLDLEKIAVKANEANIPINMMGKLLTFAQQRARDTGEDVTALTFKIIEGLGKGTPKALAGLGISVAEVKQEFKNTGDMVQAVSNIIDREMAQSGKDVDTLGDRVGTMSAKWTNAKESVGGFFAKLFSLQKTTDLADQEEVQELTNKITEKYGELAKVSDKQLEEHLKNQKAKMDKANAEMLLYEQKSHSRIPQLVGSLVAPLLGNPSSKADEQAKKSAEAYQAEKNAYMALNSEKTKRVVAKGGNDGTVDAIDAQIAKQVDLQKDLAKTSEEWKKYQAVIDGLNKQKAAITGVDPEEDKAKRAEEAAKRKAAAEKKAMEAHLAASAALTEKIKEFNSAELADTLSKNDKEVQSLQNKYNKEIHDSETALTKLKQDGLATATEIQTHQAEIDQLKVNKNKAVADLILKQQQATTAAIKQYQEDQTGSFGTELDKQTEKNNKFYDGLLKNARKDDIGGIIEIQVGRWVSNYNAELAEKKKLIAEKEKLDDDYATLTDNKAVNGIAKINKQYDLELKALQKAYTGKLRATKEYKDAEAAIKRNKDAAIALFQEQQDKEWKDTAIQTAQEISNAAFTISQRNRQAETDAHIKDLEKQRTAALANTNLTENQKAAINADFDKQEAEIKRQQFEADKAASIEKAIMDGALGLIKLWVDPGFPAAIPLAAGLGIQTAAQVAVIASQPTPAFADGGYSAINYSEPKGYVNQPTLFKKSASGRPFSAGEGHKTEYIISSEQLKDPVIADFVGTMEANRGVRRFENGGYSNATKKPQPGTPTPTNKTAPQHVDLTPLLEEQRMTREAINNIEITWSWQHFIKESAKLMKINTDANAR